MFSVLDFLMRDRQGNIHWVDCTLGKLNKTIGSWGSCDLSLELLDKLDKSFLSKDELRDLIENKSILAKKKLLSPRNRLYFEKDIFPEEKCKLMRKYNLSRLETEEVLEANPYSFKFLDCGIVRCVSENLEDLLDDELYLDENEILKREDFYKTDQGNYIRFI